MAHTDNVEQLHVILQQSFSPEANLRGPAEDAIRNLKHVPGSTTLLLQIASEKQVSVLPSCSARAACAEHSVFQCVDAFSSSRFDG